MPINQELDILYQQWQCPNQQFVKGGVVDEDMYESCEIKVLMLLKEVNDPEQSENWSLVTLIQDQIRKLKFYPIWERVGEWNFGLVQGFPHYQNIIGSFREANISEGLLDIATTNLKKSGGTGESDYEIIRKHAIDSKELWTSEIEIIRPDIVICGGTFPIVQEILGFDYKPCASGANIGQALGTKFLDFYYPMYRISPKVLYAYFKETMIALGY
ncbi:MAG: hypothetical protein K6T72_03430 [Anoxybacillus sp.]|nr:hypothetical protein [Anoxybacillus sp.]MCL6585559.1 hypothetical protein [Anoxybacillus sp.]